MPLKISRYTIGVFESFLWVKCQDCVFDIFTWRSENPLPVSQVSDSMERHEASWHKTSSKSTE
jgi:hypothetical protein